MNKNNQMYNMYKNMKQGYADSDDTVVEQCAAGWMQLAIENPFTYDTPEYNEFFLMKKGYDIWAKGAVDRKINRRRMVQHAKALCALNVKNPYIYDKKAEQEEQKAKEEWIAQEQQRKQEDFKKMDEPKKVINEEPEIVLGVIPEEKEEKKSWFKFLKPRHKEGE